MDASIKKKPKSHHPSLTRCPPFPSGDFSWVQMLVVDESMVLPHVVLARKAPWPLPRAVRIGAVVLRLPVCVSVVALKFVQVGEYLVAAGLETGVLFPFVVGRCSEQSCC